MSLQHYFVPTVCDAGLPASYHNFWFSPIFDQPSHSYFLYDLGASLVIIGVHAVMLSTGISQESEIEMESVETKWDEI